MWAIIIVLLLLLCWYTYNHGMSTEHMSIGGWVRLYEKPNSQGLAFDYAGLPGSYYKQIMPINLKSVDIYLPPNGNKSDEIKRVEIWSLGGANNSSLLPGFYNSYLEPENELRANPAKYHMVLRVLPGQHVVQDITVPVKKIMLLVNY
jgi:hypothetical protein